jgi:ABC-type uncharacterized transport system permease subunit
VAPESASSIFLMIALLPFAYAIGFFLNFMFGCITFWITETEGANSFYNYFKKLLSGNFIPLSILLSFIPLLDFQPFAWLLHHPIQIYLGKYTSVEILWVFVGAVGWSVVLGIMATLIFQKALKRNESVGL